MKTTMGFLQGIFFFSTMDGFFRIYVLFCTQLYLTKTDVEGLR